MEIDDRHICLKIPATIPLAYYDGWFRIAHTQGDHVIAISSHSGRDAESDAQYVIDRCASGLHFGIERV